MGSLYFDDSSDTIFVKKTKQLCNTITIKQGQYF